MTQTIDTTCTAGVYTLLGEASDMLVQLKSQGPVVAWVGATAPDNALTAGVLLGKGEDDISAVGFNDMEAGDEVYLKPLGSLDAQICLVASGIVAIPGGL